ncbi:hypothetical protein C9374_002930 [Naegleria lovaniensis]|uniref:Uncharacterized protein n=1 Tax=Naegleria lovaniensis TaxID=51637 RepID=A0AA88KLW9_NAELO|nr:uncharacterized protein C9374_002930 [Naegleria lovaniensis]KAG2385781.1 hypothetical protein C9374_002930 [Naegleria lovaniensis]
MIEDHIDFVDTQEEHSLLRERLPHKLTYSNFCKRVMLLVFHYLVRDGKEPKFYRRPLVKRELIENLLREKDPHFYSIVNPSIARELHTLLNTNSEMKFKQAIAIVFAGILNMETLQSLHKVTTTTTNVLPRRRATSNSKRSSSKKRSSNEDLSDGDDDDEQDDEQDEDDQIATSQRDPTRVTSSALKNSQSRSRRRRHVNVSSQSQTTSDNDEEEKQDVSNMNDSWKNLQDLDDKQVRI